MPRTRFAADPHFPHRATVSEWDDLRDEYVETEYYAPPNGGYVRYGIDGRQICEGLCSSGPTLLWYPADGPLVDVLRREHRRTQAQVLRWYQRDYPWARGA